MPGNFQLPFIKKEPASKHDAFSFFFDRLSTDFSFLPGQYIRMILDKDFEDERGKSRFFSIASSPSEQDHIMITTRIIESGFKKTLSNLEIGDKVTFSGPYGRIVFDEADVRPRVLIAGGIGITPFRSMIKYAVDKKLSIPITQLCSFSTVEEIIYRDELEKIANTYSTFRNIVTITRPMESKTAWSGESGRVTVDMIEKYVPNPFECFYFIAGPEALVESLSKIVVEMGIKDDMIVTESFPGY